MSDIDGTELHASPELEFASGKVRASAEALGEELRGLRADLQPMLDHWQGRTRDRFEPYQQEWDASATNLFDPTDGHLGFVANALHDIWIHYVETEMGNANTWNL